MSTHILGHKELKTRPEDNTVDGITEGARGTEHKDLGFNADNRR